MKFGLSFLPDCAPDTKPAGQYLSDALALAVAADRGGLDVVKITEHYLDPYGGYCPNPLTFLTAVAARTSRVRLMTGGLIAAFHHPVRLASEIALVDQLSGGRLEVGFVRGYMPYEFDALGVPMGESRPRFEATIQAVDALLSRERVTVETPFFRFRDATILPRPAQSPRPPIWCAATSSRESFVWAARNGYDLMVVFAFNPLDRLKEQVSWYRAERPEGRVSVFVPLLIDRDHDKAVALGRTYLARYHGVWAAAARSWQERQADGYDPMYRALPQLLQMANYDFMNAVGSVFFGGPKHVAAKLAALRDGLGPDQVLFNLDIGAMPLEVSSNTLELFINEVLPTLRASGDAAR